MKIGRNIPQNRDFFFSRVFVDEKGVNCPPNTTGADRLAMPLGSPSHWPRRDRLSSHGADNRTWNRVHSTKDARRFAPGGEYCGGTAIRGPSPGGATDTSHGALRVRMMKPCHDDHPSPATGPALPRPRVGAPHAPTAHLVSGRAIRRQFHGQIP